jgi:penicillin-binding protein 1A
MSKLVKRFLYISFVCGIIGFFGGAGTLLYINNNLPKVESLNVYEPSVPSFITSRDGEVLAKLSVEDRQVIEIDKIPDIIVASFLAAEDDNFYNHAGFDILGFLRALVANIKAGGFVQGGSTITQQVAKSFLLTSERSIIRKLKDILLALKIERKFSKKDILHLYLNQVYLGGGYYGVKSAFTGYFGKDLSEITIAEAAMVAGLLVAPGRYSPYINPTMAKRRQRYVLGRLFKTGKIKEDQYKAALEEKIKYRLKKATPFKAGYFTDWVRQRIIKLVGKQQFLTGGYRIKTTLNMDLQKVAEAEVLSGVRAIDKRQGFIKPTKSIALKDKEVFPSEEYLKHVEEKRKDTYKKQSNYFTINETFEKEFEVQIGKEELKNTFYSDESLKDLMSLRFFFKGYNENDPYLENINVDGVYPAVVIKSFNRGEAMIVEVAGIRGIISKKGYKWAHERSILEKPQWHAPVKRPSTLAKAGDIIKVRVKSKKRSLLNAYSKEYRKKVYDTQVYKKNVERFKEQIFLDCELEQTPEVQAALVSISPSSGEIISFVGGSDFSRSQFNRVIQSLRQPGSSFKPILFAAGLENGYQPNSVIIDSPEALASNDIGVNWKPRNYDGKFKGPMTLRRALETSRNIPTIKLAQEVGVGKIHNFAKRIGFSADMDKDLSLSLGSFGATLLDMVKAYAIFPSGGKYIEPTSVLEIRDREGKPIEFYEEKGELILGKKEEKIIEKTPEPEKEEAKQKVVEGKPEESSDTEGEKVAEEKKEKEIKVNPFTENLSSEQVYDSRLAYIMTNLLKGVVSNGTGAKARSLSPFVGGKTGTTSNYVDAWFIGFASNIVTGVWTGFDQNQTMGYGEAGSKSSLPIWKAYMEKALEEIGKVDFQVPDGIVNVYINKETGQPEDGAAYLESFVEGFEPGTEQPEEKLDEDTQLNIIEDDDFYDSL